MLPHDCADFFVFWLAFKILKPEQNGHPFSDDIFKWGFLNEKSCILIDISPKFVPRDPINIKLSLLQIMAWCHQAASHCLNQYWHILIYVTIYGITGPQWVNTLGLHIFVKIQLFQMGSEHLYSCTTLITKFLFCISAVGGDRKYYCKACAVDCQTDQVKYVTQYNIAYMYIQGSKFHSSDRLRRVKMTVGQVGYLQDLSDRRLRISDFHISCIGFLYFRQVNGTFW